MQLKTFWGILDRNIRSKLPEFCTHKIQESLTVTICALYLTDSLTRIKKTAGISSDSPCGESPPCLCLAGSLTQPLRGGNIPPVPGFFGVNVPAADGLRKKKKKILQGRRDLATEIWRGVKQSSHARFHRESG